jgi:thioredoxin-related protein
MLRKIIAYSVCFLILNGKIFSQEEPNGLVTWLSFKDAQEKNKIAPRPFIIDFYTDWCGWCKHMMRTTYSNPGLAQYINANFYPVKFNAETKDTIEYNGKVYKPVSKDPKTPHELTLKFLGNSLSYPSTVFVTNNYEYNLLTQGYLEDKKIEPLLIFMVENAWRTTVFDEFNRHFTHTFVDTTFAKAAVKFTDIKDLEKVNKKKPRKVLVNITSGFCNSCKVMNKTTFKDTSIASVINKNFYLVNLDAELADTIKFKNEKYFKTPVNNYPLHTLALKLTGNRFTLPALCILDEELNTIEVLNYYQSPEQIKPVLLYFSSNSYKTKPWKDFISEYTQSKTAPKSKK